MLSKDELLKKFLEHCLGCPAYQDTDNEVVRSLLHHTDQADKRRSKTFLKRVPEPEKWSQVQNERVGDVAQYESIISCFCIRAGIPQEADSPIQPSGSLVDVGNAFATVASSSLSTAELQTSFAHFQVFILLSYLAFLEDNGWSRGVIESILERVPQLNKIYCVTLLSAVRKANDLIRNLVGIGWSVFPATELFFLGAPSPSDLTRYTDDDWGDVFAELQKRKYTNDKFATCMQTQYTIPGLIYDMLRSGDSVAYGFRIEDVCRIFKLESHIIAPTETVRKVFPARNQAPLSIVLELPGDKKTSRTKRSATRRRWKRRDATAAMPNGGAGSEQPNGSVCIDTMPSMCMQEYLTEQDREFSLWSDPSVFNS